MINSRLVNVERAFIVERGIYSDHAEYRHVIFSSSRLDEYGGVIFASVMDPIIKLKNAYLRGDFDDQKKWMKNVKLALMNVQYCIESAILILNLEGFYD